MCLPGRGGYRCTGGGKLRGKGREGREADMLFLKLEEEDSELSRGT